MAEQRVDRIEVAGRTAWRKRYATPGRKLRLAALDAVARGLDLTPLRPPPAADPCATERAMIERLAALGAQVPEVLAAAPNELVLSDLGPTLSGLCKAESNLDRRESLLIAGLDGLADLHARGGHASQAFARNLTVNERGIGFIDLEQDPLTVMPLPAAQARDLLFYLHSTARFMAELPERYADLYVACLARTDRDVRHAVVRCARGVRWLTPMAALAGERSRALAVALRVLMRCALSALLPLTVVEAGEDSARMVERWVEERSELPGSTRA